MATIQANIKYATNLAELQRNLALGRDAIETTAASADRLAARLGGDKLIRGAHTLVAAIDQLGGVTKLTRSEQERALVTLDKTIEKMQLMGKTVPSDMQRTADALRKVSTEADNSGGAFSRLSTWAISVGTAIGTFVGHLAYDAVRRLGSAIVDIAQRGLTMAPVVSSFNALTRAIGESGDEMLRMTRSATKGLILDLDIMAAANKAMLLGLPVTSASMATMAETAVVLGKAMNLGPTKALDDLTTALGRSSPMILDNLGLSVKVGEANDKYAASLHKAAAQLTDAEKKLAFYNAAMDAARAKVEELGGVQLTLADQVLRVKNFFINFTDQLGVAIATSPVLNELLGALADTLEDAFSDNQVANVQRMVGWVNALGMAAVEATQAIIDGIRGIHVLYSAVATAVLGFSTAIGAAIAGVAAGTNAIVTLASKVPGLGAAFEDAAEHGAALTAKTWESTKGLAALTAENARAVAMQGPVQEALGATSGRLNEIRERLRQASQQTLDHGDVARRILGPDGEATKAISEGAKKILASLTGADAQKRANEIAEAFAAAGDASRLSATKVAEFARELLELSSQGARIPPSMRSLVDQFRRLDGVQVDTAKSARDLAKAHAAAGVSMQQLETDAKRAADQQAAIKQRYEELARAVREPVAVKIELPTLDWIERHFKPIGVKIRETLAGALSNLPDVILGAIQGGGDVGRAIGASLGGDLTQGLGDVVGKSLSGVLGKTIGGALGSIIPGLGSLFGGLLGSLVGGLFRDKEHEQVNDLRDDLMASLGGLRGAHATIAATANDPALLAAFERLYSAKRVEDYEQAVEAFQKRYGELMDQFQAATSQSGTLWNQTVRSMILNYEDLGLTVQDVQAIIATQRDALASSLGAVAAATAGSQEEFDRLSRIGLAAFNTLTAAGLSPIQAIQAIGPSIDSLIGQLEEMGFTGNEAFNQLLRLSTLVSENEAVLGQLDGLNQLLIATANLGGLTADSFADIEAQGLSAFRTLTAAGFSHEEALAQIAPLLATIEQLHKDNKVAISDETQELINQAREQGLIAADALTTNDILMTGLQGIATLFANIFGVQVPDLFGRMVGDAEEAADGVNRAFEGIRLPDVGGVVSPAPVAGGGPTVPGFPGGTPGLDYLSFGRRTSAELHGDEAIVPRSGVGQFAKDVAEALGGQGGGGSVSIENLIIKTDRLDRGYVRDELVNDLAEALREVPDARRKINRGLSSGG